MSLSAAVVRHDQRTSSGRLSYAIRTELTDVKKLWATKLSLSYGILAHRDAGVSDEAEDCVHTLGDKCRKSAFWPPERPESVKFGCTIETWQRTFDCTSAKDETPLPL